MRLGQEAVCAAAFQPTPQHSGQAQSPRGVPGRCWGRQTPVTAQDQAPGLGENLAKGQCDGCIAWLQPRLWGYCQLPPAPVGCTRLRLPPRSEGREGKNGKLVVGGFFNVIFANLGTETLNLPTQSSGTWAELRTPGCFTAPELHPAPVSIPSPWALSAPPQETGASAGEAGQSESQGKGERLGSRGIWRG